MMHFDFSAFTACAMDVFTLF